MYASSKVSSWPDVKLKASQQLVVKLKLELY